MYISHQRSQGQRWTSPSSQRLNALGIPCDAVGCTGDLSISEVKSFYHPNVSDLCILVPNYICLPLHLWTPVFLLSNWEFWKTTYKFFMPILFLSQICDRSVYKIKLSANLEKVEIEVLTEKNLQWSTSIRTPKQRHKTYDKKKSTLIFGILINFLYPIILSFQRKPV